MTVAPVTDEEIQAVAATATSYALMTLRWTAERHMEGADAIEHEHQRRMLGLRAAGTIAVLCPVLDETVAGVGVMPLPVEEARSVMAEDPCVRAGMMTVEVLPCVGFPGDALPG